MKPILILLVTAILAAQTTFTVGGSSVAFQPTRPRSTVTFSSPDIPAASDGRATIDITLTTTVQGSATVVDKDKPSSFQLDVAWPSTGVTSVVVSIGPAAQTAGKTLTCNRVVANLDRCIVQGGTSVIQNGVVIRAAVTVTQSSMFRLLGPVASNQFASALFTVVPGTGPNITFTPAPAVASLTCGSLDLWPGETTACTVTLATASPAGGAVYQIVRASGTDKTAPTSLSVPAGQTTGTFQVTAQ